MSTMRRLLRTLTAPFRPARAPSAPPLGKGRKAPQVSDKEAMDRDAKEMARLIAKYLKVELAEKPAADGHGKPATEGRHSRREAIRAAKSAARRASRLCSVISFPKSGRTWLRVMLDNLKLPANYTHDGSGHSRTGHVEEIEPATGDYAGKSMVFLFRDPRDTVVSGFFQTSKRLGGYRGTISDFIRDPHHGIEKIIRFNMEWLERGDSLGPFHSLTYEDLKSDTAGALAQIVAFVGAERSAEEIQAAVDEASFDKMRDMELTGALGEVYGRAMLPADSEDPQSFKVREGLVGGFRNHLSEDDIAYCDEILKRFAYPLERHGAREA